MSYILDANILFSGMLSGKNIYRKLFEENTVYTTEFALHEIWKYEKFILSKTKMSEAELKSFTLYIFSHLQIS